MVLSSTLYGPKGECITTVYQLDESLSIVPQTVWLQQNTLECVEIFGMLGLTIMAKVEKLLKHAINDSGETRSIRSN